MATIHEEIYSGEAVKVVTATANGELAVLPGHAPLLASLRPGVLRIEPATHDPASDEEGYENLVICGGFLEVQPDSVTILADAVERAEEIDVALAKKAAEQAKQIISSGPREEIDRALVQLEIALARLFVGNRKPRRKNW